MLSTRPIPSTTPTQIGFSALGLLVILSGCDCGGELNVIAPQIAVDVCKDPPLQISGRLVGGVRDCDVALDTQDISVRRDVEIQVTNPSTIPLTINDVYFTEDSDPAFEVLHSVDEVGSGLTSVWLVGFRPMVESAVSGTLVIRSDAENLVGAEDIRIEFSGAGVNNGVPDIEISPPECDFNRVAKGSVAVCNLTVTNVGQRELVFDEVTILGGDDLQVPPDSQAEAFGFIGRPPARDDAVPAQTDNSVTLGVRFSPDVLGNYFGKLRIRTNDPDEPEIDVTLTGIGVNPPNCAVTVQSVNGIPAGPGATIEPLDDVILSAEGSEPSTLDGSIVSVEWSIVQQPPGSTAILTNPAGLTTGFTFANGVAGLDLAGRYRVRAIVTDDLGTESVNECEVEFEAIPTDTILTQLSWDTSFGDMDLHLIKMNDSGEFCGSSGVDLGSGVAESCAASGGGGVCYYANCKQTSFSRPDWDNNGDSNSDGDPSLDIDDLCGYGPENINIDLAVPGQYLVGVDFFGFTGCSGSGPVGNTLRIYLFGQLQAEFYRELESGDWWEPAIIHWPGEGGVPCVEDLSTTELECPNP